MCKCKKTWVEDMIDFETGVINSKYPSVPTIPDEQLKKLRVALIEEEVGETLNAIKYNDMVEIADGIVDSIVVLIGTALAYGINLDPIWEEIHKSNMAKKDGWFRYDGKLMKPDNWVAPDVKKILIDQGWSKE